MKKTILFTFLILILESLNIIQAQNIIVSKTDNSFNSYKLTSLKTITFSDFSMKISQKSGANTISALGNISKIHFDVDEISGLSDSLTNNSISVYPNPFSNEFNTIIPENTKSYIVDIYGKKQHIEVVNGITNTSSLLSGCYFLILESNNKCEVIRLLKL